MTMQLWNAPDSIFAPILAAVPAGTDWAGYGNALYASIQSVPSVEVPRSLGGQILERDRNVRQGTTFTDGKRFAARVGLGDKKPDGTWVEFWWELGLTILKDGLLTPAVPEDFETAILQVTDFQLIGQIVVGAPQLALTRHLWAESVKSASPGAIVFGGQHHWSDDWWNQRETAEGEAQ